MRAFGALILLAQVELVAYQLDDFLVEEFCADVNKIIEKG